MTKHYYYSDAYTIQFDARIVERLAWDGRHGVILDGSFFYPTSGGQPHDTGFINDVPVIDVLERPSDGAIIHILDGQLEGDQAAATVNWDRRFDHMQHHTGQHILSQAFILTTGAETIGFHMSDKSITIDLDQVHLTKEQIYDAEQLTNEIIWQNRSINVLMVSPEEATALAIRKAPPKRKGQLRLVEIDDFDLTACGGTHVADSGEVGFLKIIKTERRGEKRRVEFRCGQRALDAYRQSHALVEELKSEFTTSSDQVLSHILRLREENKNARRQLKKQRAELAKFEVLQLINDGQKSNGFTLIAQTFSGRDPKQVRSLSQQIIREQETITLFAVVGERSQLIFGRSAEAPGDMEALLKFALAELGSRSGGGNEQFAQGMSPVTESSRINEAIDRAKAKLLGKL